MHPTTFIRRYWSLASRQIGFPKSQTSLEKTGWMLLDYVYMFQYSNVLWEVSHFETIGLQAWSALCGSSASLVRGNVPPRSSVMDVNTYTYWVLQGKKHRHQQVLSTIAAPPAPRQLSVEVHDHGRETLLLKLLFFWRPPGVPNIELGDSWARITPENHVGRCFFYEEPGIICFHLVV